MDISEWEVVEIANVPPGPLGILLDGHCPEAAILEDFAQVASDGSKGVVELDGRILPGSVLVAVNDIDLLHHKLSLQEVGRILRDTSHLVRTLYFKVPPKRSLDAIEVSGINTPSSPTHSAVGDVEDRVLLKGVAQSSYKEPKEASSKRSWNLIGMLSPTQIATSVAALSGFGSSSTSAPSTPATAGHEPVITAVETKSDSPVIESPPTSGIRSATLTIPTSPPNQLTVTIPPGPIGLNLDGSFPDRAVVLGFLPLPDGSAGALERRGDIPLGSVLVAINGADVSHLSLDEIRHRLGALASFDRDLVLQLPPLPVNPDGTRVLTAKDRRDAFERLSDLDKRRKIELGLVLKYDKTTIKRHECWFLVDAHWMASWVEFTARGGMPPGPITNQALLEPDWEARLSGLAKGRPDAPRLGLERMKDYRCVTPMVWALFAEFHGTNNVPLQARYVLDAYAEPLVDSDISSILQQPRLQAASTINDLRDRYPGAFSQ